MYKVFIRRWYRDHPTKKGEVVPGLGRKTTIGSATSVEEAQRKCKEYNDNHRPGKYSVKAEFEKY